jgi:hypothetical protein
MTNNCTPTASGTPCPAPSDWKTCRPWDMTQQPNTTCYADGLVEETLNIAGATINIHKLLGIHEQTKLIDLTGNGSPLSGGDAPLFPAINAFTVHSTEWQSKQSGMNDILRSAFIGYDFGIVRLPNGRQRYGIDAPIRQHITTIKIKQSDSPIARIAKVRVERSEDNIHWYGVAILTLPNDDNLNTLHFKHSVPSRYWRLRPLDFVGTTCDSWGIQALEMLDYSATHISNIQDKILLENRDRDYNKQAISIKGYYDLVNVSTDLSRFGIETPSGNYQIKINFNACVAALNRPVVIGDIIELPSETQFGPDLQPVKKWLEVTDVTWDAGSYTPGWRPTLLLITAQPALASQETQSIFGDLAQHVGTSGLYTIDDGNIKQYQDISTISQTIAADAATQVPERGSEGSNTAREFNDDNPAVTNSKHVRNLKKLNIDNKGLFVEDALPPNGESYTEGVVFPVSPKDNQYHRLTYEGMAKDITTRLYRWSKLKQRWVYLEADKRAQYNDQKAILEDYTTSPTKISARKIK